LTENDGHENDGPSKLQGMKLQDMNLRDTKTHYSHSQPLQTHAPFELINVQCAGVASSATSTQLCD